MTAEELATLKAVAFGTSELAFDAMFWSDGGTNVQALIAEIEKLRAALSASRGQWIHSVNAEQCMIAMGWEVEWREIQARRQTSAQA